MAATEISTVPGILIVDIDGTLSDTKHRLHHVTGPKKNWKAFYEGAKHDPCIGHVRDLVSMYHSGGNLICLLTARPESMREETIAWMEKMKVPYTMLLMRPIGDNRKDAVVKEELFMKHFSNVKSAVKFALEDRLHVAEMWRKLGLNVLLCGDEWCET